MVFINRCGTETVFYKQEDDSHEVVLFLPDKKTVLKYVWSNGYNLQPFVC